MTDPAQDPPRGEEPPLTRADARTAAEGSPLYDHVRAARSEFEHQVDRARADFDRARADFEHVNERINERTGRPLLMAILIGVGIGAVVLASLLLVKWAFLLFAVPVCLLGIFEFSRALQTAGRRIDVWPQLAAGAVILLSGALLGHWTHWVLTFASVAAVIVWRLIAQMAAGDGRRYGEVVTDVLVTGFVPIYVPFLASLALVLLRKDQGELWVLGMIVTVVAADTGAYASGLAFGRHPMAPRISPKKTWEGFAGGAALTAVVGVAYGLFVLHIPWWAGLVFGLVMLGFATVGDLSESMIKRDLGIKDMSSWLPGHGGVLDRLDSILPSAGAALALYVFFFPLVSS